MKNFIFSFFLLLSSFSTLSADYIYNEYCIKDFLFKDGYFYYLRSDNDTWYSSSSFYKYRFDSGYIYNSDTEECIKNPDLLGLSEESFTFLNGLIAVFVSVLMVWSLL